MKKSKFILMGLVLLPLTSCTAFPFLEGLLPSKPETNDTNGSDDLSDGKELNIIEIGEYLTKVEYELENNVSERRFTIYNKNENTTMIDIGGINPMFEKFMKVDFASTSEVALTDLTRKAAKVDIKSITDISFKAKNDVDEVPNELINQNAHKEENQENYYYVDGNFVTSLIEFVETGHTTKESNTFGASGDYSNYYDNYHKYDIRKIGADCIKQIKETFNMDPGSENVPTLKAFGKNNDMQVKINGIGYGTANIEIVLNFVNYLPSYFNYSLNGEESGMKMIVKQETKIVSGAPIFELPDPSNY